MRPALTIQISFTRVLFAVFVTLLEMASSASPIWSQPLGIPAQPPARGTAPPKLAPQDAVAIAMKNNLSITSQTLALQQAEFERRSTYSDLLPGLKLQYSSNINRYWQQGNFAYLSGKHPSRWQFRGSTAVGNTYTDPNAVTLQPEYPYRIDPYKNFQLSATLTQNIYSGGLLTSAFRNAGLAVIGSTLGLETAKQDLALAVLKAYYQAVLGKKQLDVAEESIRDLSAFKNRAQAMYKVGEALKVDITAAEAQLARARVQRMKAFTDLKTSRSTLDLLLGFIQCAPYELDDNLVAPSVEYCCPEIYTVAVMNRLEVKRANISVEQAKNQVKMAQAALVPSITVAIQGQRTNDDWNVIDPEGTNEWSIQGQLSWSFDFCRSRRTVSKRLVAEAQSDVDKKYLIEQIVQQVHSAYLQLERSKSDVIETKKEVSYRQEQFSLVKKQYNEQLATYLNVMDAQTGLDRAKTNHFAAVTDHLITLATLQRQMGILR